MKNFRKVLALILVVATLFSFVAMASAKEASEYKDYDEVKNVVAVDILTALGINEGSDGKFHPAATIDRDEVAAMIARLRNGGKFDPTYYVGADNVFADVKGQWSEGYVTYCAQLGIINGLNATTFNPDGKITVVEAAKLLLCVLGYDAQLQGYVGPNWKVAVVRDAEKMGILAGIPAADVYKEATRDQVALMFFNALQARLVYGYVSENIVTLTNSLVKGIPWITVPDLADPKVEIAYNNAIVSEFTLGNILGVYSVPAQDCFGRPLTKWIAGTWSKFYPVAASKTTVDGTNVYGTTDAEKAAQAAATVYHNGQVCNHDLADLLGKGVIVERYADRVVVIDTFMSIVESVSVRYGTMVLSNGNTINNTVGAKAGDVVMYTLCDKDGTDDYTCGDKQAHEATGPVCGDFYHDMSIVAPVEVKVEETHRVTAAPAASYIVTAEGNTYYYSKNLDIETYGIASGFPADVDLDIMDWTAKGKTWWLYLDPNNNIQYWTAPADAATTYDVAYFVENTNTWTEGNTGTNNTAGEGALSYAADIVNMKAEESNIAVSETIYEAMYSAWHVDQAGQPYKIGVLGAYGSAIPGGFKAAKVADVNTYMDSATGELVGERWTGNRDGVNLNMHANADTQYLIRTFDFATGAYSYSTGLGYKSVADYIGKVVVDNAQKGTVAIPVIQYLDLDDNGIIDYLFVDAFYKKVTAEYVHVLKIEENIGVAALDKFFPAFDLYSAYVNGEKAYVAYYGEELSANTLYQTNAQAVNATYKGAPIYVALTEANLVNLAKEFSFNQIRVENGQIALYVVYQGGESVTERLPAAYNADLTIYVKDGATVTTMTGAEFVAKYSTDEWFAGDYTDGTSWTDAKTNVYALEYPGVIKTLIIELY